MISLPRIRSAKSLCLLLCAQAMLLYTDAFLLRPPARTVSQLQVGNLIAGITGIAPSQPLLSKNLEKSLVIGTFLERANLKCVYRASSDGWSALNFHRCVDGKGSGLVVALSRSGKLFGGYNPLGWRSTDDYYDSNSAFMWFEQGGKAIKCPVFPGGKQSMNLSYKSVNRRSLFTSTLKWFEWNLLRRLLGNAAIFDYATGGPCFGASDLIIGPPKAAVMGGFTGPDMQDTSMIAGNLREGRCNAFGGSYELNGKKYFWPIRGSFQLVQLEAYCNTAIIQSSSRRMW